MLPFLPLDGAAARTPRADKRWIAPQAKFVDVFGLSSENANDLLDRIELELYARADQARRAGARGSGAGGSTLDQIRRNALTIEKDRWRAKIAEERRSGLYRNLKTFEKLRSDAYIFLTETYETMQGIMLLTPDEERRMYESATALWKLLAQNNLPVAKERPELTFKPGSTRQKRVKPFIDVWKALTEHDMDQDAREKQ